MITTRAAGRLRAQFARMLEFGRDGESDAGHSRILGPATRSLMRVISRSCPQQRPRAAALQSRSAACRRTHESRGMAADGFATAAWAGSAIVAEARRMQTRMVAHMPLAKRLDRPIPWFHASARIQGQLNKSECSRWQTLRMVQGMSVEAHVAPRRFHGREPQPRLGSGATPMMSRAEFRPGPGRSGWFGPLQPQVAPWARRAGALRLGHLGRPRPGGMS